MGIKVTNGKETIEVEPIDFKELKNHGYTAVSDSGQTEENRETVKDSEDKPKVKRGRKKKAE